MKKISIITATYNSSQTLRACLASVERQTAIADIEHIIVDGRSSDQTLKVAAEFPHIAQIVSSKDRGIYHAFNKGVALASGEFIYFLNSDDELHDAQVIEDVIAQLTDDIDFYSGTIVWDDESTKLRHQSIAYHANPQAFKPVHPGFFCRRALFESIGPFNECLNIAADMYFMKRAIQQFQGVFTERVIAIFSKLGISSDSQNRANILLQDEFIDRTLGVTTYGSSLEQRLASSMSTASQLKRLLLASIEGELAIDGLINADQRIAIFGIREVSEIVCLLLQRQGIQIECFLISHPDNQGFLRNIPIKGLEAVAQDQPDIIVNCIEGAHEKAVSESINKVLYEAKVISWREFAK